MEIWLNILKKITKFYAMHIQFHCKTLPWISAFTNPWKETEEQNSVPQRLFLLSGEMEMSVTSSLLFTHELTFPLFASKWFSCTVLQKGRLVLSTAVGINMTSVVVFLDCKKLTVNQGHISFDWLFLHLTLSLCWTISHEQIYVLLPLAPFRQPMHQVGFFHVVEGWVSIRYFTALLII